MEPPSYGSAGGSLALHRFCLLPLLLDDRLRLRVTSQGLAGHLVGQRLRRLALLVGTLRHGPHLSPVFRRIRLPERLPETPAPDTRRRLRRRRHWGRRSCQRIPSALPTKDVGYLLRVHSFRNVRASSAWVIWG